MENLHVELIGYPAFVRRYPYHICTVHLLRNGDFFSLWDDVILPQVLIHHTAARGTLSTIYNILHTKGMAQLMRHHCYKRHIVLSFSLDK